MQPGGFLLALLLSYHPHLLHGNTKLYGWFNKFYSFFNLCT